MKALLNPAFIGLFGLGVLGIVGIRSLCLRAFPAPGCLPAGWSPLAAFLAILVFLVTNASTYLLFEAASARPGFLGAFGIQMLSWAVAGVFILWVGRRAGGLGTLGFSPARGRGILAAVLAYFCFLPGYLVIAKLWQVLLTFLRQELPAQGVLLELLRAEAAGFAALVFGVVLGGPFFEELFFRCFLQPSLDARFGWPAAWLGSSVLFAVVHEPIAYVPTFALGLFFGYLYRRSGRFVVPFLAHALHNALMVVLWIQLPEWREAMGH